MEFKKFYLKNHQKKSRRCQRKKFKNLSRSQPKTSNLIGLTIKLLRSLKRKRNLNHKKLMMRSIKLSYSARQHLIPNQNPWKENHQRENLFGTRPTIKLIRMISAWMTSNKKILINFKIQNRLTISTITHRVMTVKN
jgi:hypothetical protein